MMADGTWLARSIRRLVPRDHRFEFVGLVERIDPWVVSGIAIETRPWTEIKVGAQGAIEVGDRVKVEGRILPDGTWLADEIKLVDEDDDLSFEFVGRVQSIEPWIVGGVSLTVDDRTEIKADAGRPADRERPIEVGDRVKVEGRILPNGEWLATEIVRVEHRLGRGCVQLTALVIRVEAGQVVLKNGATIPLADDVAIEGEIQANSVILIYLCVDDEGNITIIAIIVLYQIEPVIVVPPTPTPSSRPPPPPPSRPPKPPGGGGSIVVSENNQTRTFTCNGHSVTINGNNNTITLRGSCGPVTIRGNSNWVSIESATSVTNRGNNNTVVGP
jgi:hypothetical protein